MKYLLIILLLVGCTKTPPTPLEKCRAAMEAEHKEALRQMRCMVGEDAVKTQMDHFCRQAVDASEFK